MSYPWIIDSATGTTPSITNYLQVVAPNGLYLNSTTSGTNSNAILMTGYISGSPATNNSIVYYACDRIYFSTNNSTNQTVYQTTDNGNQPTIYTNNEDIIICSKQNTPGYGSSFNSSGAIYLWGSGLYLNGTLVGGGISQITSSNGSINITNPTGPTVDITTSGGGGGGVTDVQAGSGISVSSSGSGGTGSVTITNIGVVGLFTNTPSSIQINQYGSTFAVDYIGGGGGGGLSWNDLAYPSNIYTGISTIAGPDVCFGMDSYSYTGYNDIATLCISSTYSSYTGSTSPSGRIGYLKVGYDDGFSTQNFTLVTNTNPGSYSSNPCTMATVCPSASIQPDMYLWADLRSNGGQIYNSYGNGNMYLGARYILPGNGTNLTYLGSNSYAWFDVVSYSFNNISDIKLKEDITKLDSNYCINLLKNINPVIYKYKSDEKKKSHFGVIAQEIKEIIGDENLALHSDGEIQSISYNELIAPLIKTVQHLLKKVEDLEAEIKELKK